MEFIQVGRVQFHVDHLKDQTLEDCKVFFAHINGEIVKKAWKIANPKKTKKGSTE
jgi:hypothetical protein